MFVLQPIPKLVKGKIHRVEKTQKWNEKMHRMDGIFKAFSMCNQH